MTEHGQIYNSDGTVMICNFCKKENAVGVYSTHMPISLAYCQKCLDVNEIRTRHNVHMDWAYKGDSYLENNYIVFFKDNYISIKKYITELTEADVNEYYHGHPYAEMVIDKLRKRV
jgi:late competence protein required for DNA uptake (superfamily II DNA/RNA helicase)